jgi:hypothetical protein
VAQLTFKMFKYSIQIVLESTHKMGVGNDRPSDPSLQQSIHPIRKTKHNWQKNCCAACACVQLLCHLCVCDSSLAHLLSIGQSPGTCESKAASSAPQQLDSSKEWMPVFQGNDAFQNLSEVDWDNVNDPVPDEVRKGFPEVGKRLKASFSENSPAEIEYIVLISNIAEVSWVFNSKLELPPQTAKHSNVLEIAREASHAAAGLPNEWSRCIAFLVVQC